uniref:Uncharacterized protein n=1 Tax=Aegilops tauschii subsp. strangulata TaxID=200361 RepID=A0A452Y386_AEGTS
YVNFGVSLKRGGVTHYFLTLQKKTHYFLPWFRKGKKKVKPATSLWSKPRKGKTPKPKSKGARRPPLSPLSSLQLKSSPPSSWSAPVPSEARTNSSPSAHAGGNRKGERRCRR